MSIPVTKESLSIGRSDIADVRIDDPGLSRVHARIHLEDNRVWILDEDSTNGSYVNGESVPAVGAPLSDGDKISLGDYTTAWVSINGKQAGKAAETSPGKIGLLRALIIALPIAAIAIVVYFLNGEPATQIPKSYAESRSEDTASAAGSRPHKENADGPKSPSLDNNSNSTLSEIPAGSQPPPPQASAFKLYRQMTKEEQEEFVNSQAMRISKKIGDRPCDFTPGALQRIKKDVDAYASRLGSRNSAPWYSQDLRTIYERATRFAPLVIRSFNKYGVYPEVGLYMAMIESEYNKCLPSTAGALGMFQFMPGTAIEYKVQPSERCVEQKMAPAAALYFKDLIGYFGTDATSVALAIASYNRGQGNIIGDLHKVVKDGGERSFWTLVENPENLAVKFRTENIKYVPKFFAAAIIGENPREFGLDIRPLSSYTEETK